VNALIIRALLSFIPYLGAAIVVATLFVAEHAGVDGAVPPRL
jgi:hypothetical protein